MTQRTVRPRRSFIFTPGLKPEMYPKALASGTDIVCVELEDGIAPKDKAQARKSALALFENQGLAVQPFPVDSKVVVEDLSILSFLPQSGALWRTSVAVRETLGQQYYRIRRIIKVKATTVISPMP